MVVERCHLQVWGGGSAIVFFSFSFQLLIKLAFNYFFKQIYSTINSLNRKPNQPLLCNREQNLKQMRQMPSATATSQIEKRSVLFKRPKIVSTGRAMHMNATNTPETYLNATNAFCTFCSGWDGRQMHRPSLGHSPSSLDCHYDHLASSNYFFSD